MAKRKKNQVLSWFGQEINPLKNEIKPFLTYCTYAHKWEYQTSIKNKKNEIESVVGSIMRIKHYNPTENWKKDFFFFSLFGNGWVSRFDRRLIS